MPRTAPETRNSPPRMLAGPRSGPLTPACTQSRHHASRGHTGSTRAQLPVRRKSDTQCAAALNRGAFAPASQGDTRHSPETLVCCHSCGGSRQCWVGTGVLLAPHCGQSGLHHAESPAPMAQRAQAEEERPAGPQLRLDDRRWLSPPLTSCHTPPGHCHHSRATQCSPRADLPGKRQQQSDVIKLPHDKALAPWDWGSSSLSLLPPLRQLGPQPS